MKERPILFNAAMVRAILGGRKTQTRRAVKPRHPWNIEERDDGSAWPWYPDYVTGGEWDGWVQCPYGQRGDRLWVRETWQYDNWTDDGEPKIRYAADGSCEWKDVAEQDAEKVLQVWADLSVDENYNIDGGARDRRWRPSIHMPRWASRITLEVTGVRVERLQTISEEDARAEGVEPNWCGPLDKGPNGTGTEGWLGDSWIRYGAGLDAEPAYSAGESFASLWESINGAGSWNANPWVWVVEFRRVQP